MSGPGAEAMTYLLGIGAERAFPFAEFSPHIGDFMTQIGAFEHWGNSWQ